MDLLIELKKRNEVIAECFLEYYGEVHFALKLSKIILEEYTYLLNKECSSDLERAVLALRAIDAYPNMSFDYDDVDYDAVHSYVPKYTDGDLDGTGEIFAEDDIGENGADCYVTIDLDSLTSNILIIVEENDGKVYDKVSKEFSSIADLIINKEFFNIDELALLIDFEYKCLRNKNALIYKDKVIRAIYDNNY